MAAQREAFSTALPLIELWSPTVPNKTNLIDPVYKNPALLWTGACFWGFHSLFIYFSAVFSRRLRCRGSACGAEKLGLSNSLQRERTEERNSKASKLDQWPQQSIRAKAPQPPRLSRRSEMNLYNSRHPVHTSQRQAGGSPLNCNAIQKHTTLCFSFIYHTHIAEYHT